jgi:hypothetical protein
MSKFAEIRFESAEEAAECKHAVSSEIGSTLKKIEETNIILADLSRQFSRMIWQKKPEFPIIMDLQKKKEALIGELVGIHGNLERLREEYKTYKAMQIQLAKRSR